MKIVIDTNMLISAVQYKVDIFEQLQGYELVTLSNCIEELWKIAKGRSKSSTNARIALELIEKNGVMIEKSAEKSTDAAIIKYAMKNRPKDASGFAAATNDRKLIKALKNNGIKVIRLRQRKYLTEDWGYISRK